MLTCQLILIFFPNFYPFFSEIYVFSIAHFKLEKEKLEKNQKVMTKKNIPNTRICSSREKEKKENSFFRPLKSPAVHKASKKMRG